MDAVADRLADIPYDKVARVDAGLLKLDERNPRLVGTTADNTQEEIAAQLYRREALGELLQSIAANGYLDLEPLIVWLAPGDESLTVLEGNRRLAALRLFREPEFVSKVAGKAGFRISVPEMAEDRKGTLSEVSVYRVRDREDARAFIGFKHIKGAVRWQSFAKARFAGSMVQVRRSHNRSSYRTSRRQAGYHQADGGCRPRSGTGRAQRHFLGIRPARGKIQFFPPLHRAGEKALPGPFGLGNGMGEV